LLEVDADLAVQLTPLISLVLIVPKLLSSGLGCLEPDGSERSWHRYGTGRPPGSINSQSGCHDIARFRREDFGFRACRVRAEFS